MRIKNDHLKLDIQKFADGEIKFKVDLDSTKAESGVSKLKASSVAVGNLLASGIQQGTQALINLGKQALSSAADLEQNIGGVETLFKDSANTVIENANNAFKTAGMSANDYMSTVTSFSASLLQGLGGDTAKAAQIADTAIVDMSDNANKMGTSMELIQNAYQGFAKQNYTMLDNLKLGYGGTQSEMARLINDSGVLGDSMKVTAETVNNVSFDKIIEAIHVIQDRMGITGTTSKEAAETISGSVASMKAAFDNFLNGSGDIDTLIESITTVAKNVSAKIIEMAPNLIDGLVQLITFIASQLPGLIEQLLPTLSKALVDLIKGLIKVIPGVISSLASVLPEIIDTVLKGLIEIVNALAEQLPTLIPTIIQAILDIIPVLLENLPLFITAGIQLIMGLIQGLVTAIPLIVAQLPLIIQSIINTLISLLPQIILMAPQIIISLITGLINAIPLLVEAIPQIITSMIEGFFNGMKQFLEVGIDIISNLWNGISEAIVGVLAKIPGIPKDILQKIKDGFSKIGDIGKNLVKGLWNGINNAKDWVLDKIKGFGKSILNGIKSFFGIHSPSTEFAWIGKMNILGLEEGMEDNIPDLNKTIDRTISYSADTAGLDFLKNGADYVSSSLYFGIPNQAIQNYNYSNDNSETNALLFDLNKGVNALLNKDTNLYINGKALAQTTYKDFKNEGQRLGTSSTVNVR